MVDYAVGVEYSSWLGTILVEVVAGLWFGVKACVIVVDCWVALVVLCRRGHRYGSVWVLPLLNCVCLICGWVDLCFFCFGLVWLLMLWLDCLIWVWGMAVMGFHFNLPEQGYDGLRRNGFDVEKFAKKWNFWCVWGAPSRGISSRTLSR